MVGKMKVLALLSAAFAIVQSKPVKDTKCKEAIGVQTGFLEDRDIKTSSSQQNFTSYDAWCPSVTNEKQFFAVDLGEDFLITKIATQGKVDDHNRYMKSYQLQFSNDNKKWNTYKASGKEDSFDGNTDMFSVRSNDLNPAMIGRYVKLVPRSWNNGICSRMELYGCAVDDLNKAKEEASKADKEKSAKKSDEKKP